eukprot:2797337-Pyramimonas_sp.AAC.2
MQAAGLAVRRSGAVPAAERSSLHQREPSRLQVISRNTVASSCSVSWSRIRCGGSVHGRTE